MRSFRRTNLVLAMLFLLLQGAGCDPAEQPCTLRSCPDSGPCEPACPDQPDLSVCPTEDDGSTSAPDLTPAQPDGGETPEADAAPDSGALLRCLDEDEDGYPAGPDCPAPIDCHDGDPLVHPGVTDSCNGQDDDCDGEFDEDGTNCPPPCRPVIDCHDRCLAAGESDNCWMGCWDVAGTPACDQCHAGLERCAEAERCLVAGGSWDWQCFDEQCPGRYEACFGVRHFSGLCGDDYLPCVARCGADDFCSTDCYWLASFRCRTCLGEYSACLTTSGCFTPDGRLDENCFYLHCAEPFDRCFVGQHRPTCTDRDGDGFGLDCAGPPDCDDTRPEAYPGAPERCNGADDDCDGRIDDKVGPDCQPEREWAFLIYMAGDNDLADSVLAELEQLAAHGGTDGQVGVALQLELSGAESAWAGHLPVEVFERTWRLVVPGMEQPVLDQLLANAQSVGDQDISQAESLTAFLDWGAAAVPARHHAVVLWDHGGGWSGVLVDDGSNDFMSLDRLQQGLRQAMIRPEIVSFVACEMGALEVVRALTGFTDYLVASEDVSGGDSGLGAALVELRRTPTLAARDLAELLGRQAAAGSRASGMHSSWAVYDLAGAEPLLAGMRDLAAALADTLDESLRQDLDVAVPATTSMMIPEVRDLVDLTERLEDELSPDSPLIAKLGAVRQAAGAPEFLVATHIANAPPGGYGNRQLERAHGLSIFLPTLQQLQPETLEAYALADQLLGEPVLGWDQVLRAWYGERPLGRTQGDFRFELEWLPLEPGPGDGAAPLVDLDLLVAGPRGWAAPNWGSETPELNVAPDSLSSGEAQEWVAAAPEVAAGTYYVWVTYPATGLTGQAAPAVRATLRFLDDRFPDNDQEVVRELSLEQPCGAATGLISREVITGRCANLWFVGKLIRNDRPHTLVPGIYDDFSFARRWRLPVRLPGR